MRPDDSPAGPAKGERPLAWITGAGGLIGSYFVQTAPDNAPGWQACPMTRRVLDLADSQAVRHLFARERPALVVHCAAISRPVTCQENQALARQLNVEVTRVLAELATDARLVFLSSDLVFDGRRGGYREEDLPNPLGIYAETKAEAEQIVRRHPRHLIIRTSLNGGTSPTGDRAFNEVLRQAWHAGRTIPLFTDEFRSPIAAVETARAVWKLVNAGATGTFHVAGAERLSRWQIGRLLAVRWPRLHPRIEPGSLKDHKDAPRPPDTSLNCGKTETLLGAPLPRFTDWLAAQPPESF